MYPKKMTFDGFSVRTNRINVGARQIKSINVGSSEIKTGQVGINPACPAFVGMTRFELATPRPPDVYSNRAELHPEISGQK